MKFWKNKTFSRTFFLQNKKSQIPILTLLKNMGKSFYFWKMQVKLAISREIVVRPTCYFVSPKICIGHSYQTLYKMAIMLKISIIESYPRIKLLNLKVWSSVPNIYIYIFCKIHFKLRCKIRIPKLTRWYFKRSRYSKINFCLT